MAYEIPRSQVATGSPSAAAASRHVRSTSARLGYIDNIRWPMIVLVLSMHAADTYSPFGNWYYVERPPIGTAETLFFLTYQSFLQGFFMALLSSSPAISHQGRSTRRARRALPRDGSPASACRRCCTSPSSGR
jgi:hypothetical protein